MKKSWHLWASIAALVFFTFLFSQDSLARLAWQKYGRVDMALVLVRRDVKLAMELGSYYFGAVIGRGEYNLEKAERAYRKAVAADSKILWGHYQIARIRFLRGDFNGALSEINRELEANPENLRSLYVRGLIYGYRNQAGDLEKAETDFQRFTLWAPKEWAGYNDLAWILSKQGQYAEAEKTVRRAFSEIKNAEENSWLWNALGVAQLNLKKYPGAAYSFKKAKKLAEKLTSEEWRRAYPGNNPQSVEEGLSAFLKAINENLRRAENKK